MLQLKNTINNSSSNATTAGLNTQTGDVCCWETQIGQELYKLTITYFGTELTVIALADGLRWALARSKIWPWFTKMVMKVQLTCIMIVIIIQFGYAEFSLAENVLKLVYGQALVW